MPTLNPPARRQPPVSNRAQALRPAGSPPPHRQPVSNRVQALRPAGSPPPGRQPVSSRAQNAGGWYPTGTAPYSLYNGTLRIYYQYAAAGLKSAYTMADGSIDYDEGGKARLNLKSKVRGLTLNPHRSILNQTDPIKPSTKATPRFWRTNPYWNAAGKGSAALGAVGLGVAGYRIATAKNKLHETGKVASGFAGAWAGMQIVAPAAAWGAAVSGPAAPFVSGGILLIGGAAGAFGAESLFEYMAD